MKYVASARMEEKDLAALARIAEREGHTVSSLVRRVVLDWLRRQKPKAPHAAD